MLALWSYVAPDPRKRRLQARAGTGPRTVRTGSSFPRLARTVCGLAAGALAAVSGLAQEIAGTSPAVESAVSYDFERRQLSVAVSDYPLVSLLEQIAHETGLVLVVHGNGHGRVSAKFDELPLAEAMKRLLKGVNFALETDNDSMLGDTGKGDIVRLWVMSPKSKLEASPPSRLDSTRRDALARARATQGPAGVIETHGLSPEADAPHLAALLSGQGAMEEILSDIMQHPDLLPEVSDALSNQLGQTTP